MAEFINGMTAEEANAQDIGVTETNIQEQADLQQQLNRQHTAEYLSANNADKFNVGGGDDIDKEVELQQAQLALHRMTKNNENDPLRQQQLIQRCEQLASELVGGPAPSIEDDKETEDKESLTEALFDKYPNAKDYLATANSVLGNERSEQFNELLESNDEFQTTAALETLKALHEDPSQFSAADPGSTLNQDQIDWARDTFSDDIASSIKTLGDVVNSGQVSAAEAIKVAAKDPKVLSAILTGARAGKWTIAL